MNLSKKALLGAGAFVIVGCGGGGGYDGGTAQAPTPAQNQAPSIAAVADQDVDEGAVLGPLDLGVGDAETPTDALQITARAADPALLPDGGIEISGSGANRTMFLIPAADRSGTTEVTVQVADAGGARSTATFGVNVKPLVQGEFSSWVRAVVIPQGELDPAIGEPHADGTPPTATEDIPRIKFSDDSADDPAAYDDLLTVALEQEDE